MLMLSWLRNLCPTRHVRSARPAGRPSRRRSALLQSERIRSIEQTEPRLLLSAISVTAIAREGDPLPQGGGTFFSFLEPVIDEGRVLFVGNGDVFGTQGLFLFHDGTLSAIADTTTLAPGFSTPITGFDPFGTQAIDLDGTNVAFEVEGDGYRAILTSVGGVLQTRVSTDTQAPGEDNPFSFFGDLSFDGERLVFDATALDGSVARGGIFQSFAGSLSEIVDENAVVPGGGGGGGGQPLSSPPGAPDLDDSGNGRVVFSGEFFDENAGSFGDFVQGVYEVDPVTGQLSVIADGSDVLPGTSNTISRIAGQPVVDGDRVAFVATANLDEFGEQFLQAVVVDDGSSLTTVADSTMDAPGGGVFQSFTNVSLDGDHVAFTAFIDDGGNQFEALFTNVGGTLQRVVAEGATFDGRTVDQFSAIRFGREGLDGNQLAFTVRFEDGDFGVYVVTLDDGGDPSGTASVGDIAFADLNGNGLQDAGEPGLAGVTVELFNVGPDGNIGGGDDQSFGTRTTDATGSYLFSNLPAGSWFLEVSLPASVRGFSPSDQGSDDTIDSDIDPATGRSSVFPLAADQADVSRDIGVTLFEGIIGGEVFQDLDENGVREGAAELGLSGVQVTLLQPGPDGLRGTADDVSLGSTSTDTLGTYRFERLAPGDYFLRFTTPSGFSYTTPDQGGDDTLDSDVTDTATGRTDILSLGTDAADLTRDAGVTLSGGGAFVRGNVFADFNGDGIRDPEDVRFGGVTIELRHPGPDGAIGGGDDFTVVSDISIPRETDLGNTSFLLSSSGGNTLPAGSFYLHFSEASGAAFTLRDQGGDEARDSDADPATGNTSLFTLQPGDFLNELDVGFLFAPATVSGRVWHDQNGNGIQDVGEPGAANVAVQLVAVGATADLVPDGLEPGRSPRFLVTANDVPADDGTFSFSNVFPGEYVVRFSEPNLDDLSNGLPFEAFEHSRPRGFDFTRADQGHDDSLDSDVLIDAGGFYQTASFTVASGSENATHGAGLVPTAFEITRLADTTTTIPGGTGTFQFFGEALVEGDTIVFHAEGTNGEQGLYRFQNGQLELIADRNTNIPGGAGTFGSFDPFGLALRDGAVAFRASTAATVGSASGIDGLYIFQNGVITRVVDETLTIPGTSSVFAGLGDFAFDGTRMLFAATNPDLTNTGNTMGRDGLYLFDGQEIQLVVDEFSETELGERFQSFSPEAINEATLVFTARTTGFGDTDDVTFSRVAGTFHRLISTEDPDAAVNPLAPVGPVRLDGKRIVYRTTSNAIVALPVTGGTVTTLVPGNVSLVRAGAPATSGGQTVQGNPAVDDQGIAFQAGFSITSPSQGVGGFVQGLYAVNDGMLTRVIDGLDTLEPLTRISHVNNVNLGRLLDDGTVAFTASLESQDRRTTSGTVSLGSGLFLATRRTGADAPVVTPVPGDTGRLVGDQLEITDAAGQVTLTPVDPEAPLTIDGTGNDDRLEIDLSSGAVIPTGGLTFNGGLNAAGGDTLAVTGNGTTTGSYLPDIATFGDGIVEIDGRSITFTGLEPVEISDMASFRIVTTGGADALVLDSPAPGQLRISGTSDGVPFEELIITNVSELIIDTATNDAPGSDADTITVSPDGASLSTGLTQLTILTGGGNDTVDLSELAGDFSGVTVTVNGEPVDPDNTAAPLDVLLPAAGGSFEILHEGADLVVRIAGGSELVRQLAADVSVLRIIGSAEDDRVTVLDTGTSVSTPLVFRGNAGNDRFDASLATGPVNLTGNAGGDTLLGGAGNDTLTGGSQADELVGGPGSDSLNGTGGTGDTLEGGDGNDTLNGGSGNDVIREFFAGDVTLTNSAMTGRGTDMVISAERARLSGGTAAQTIDVSAFFTEGLTSVTLNGGGGDDSLVASNGNDVIVGAGGSDVMRGGSGSDRMFGGSGADTLIGGDGDDFLKGLGGSGDQLRGGAGNDTLNGGRGIDRIIESGDADFTLTNSSLAGAGHDFLLAVEVAEINAGNSDNLIDVSAFLGFRGFVLVRAGGGNDTIIGSAGPDVLNGDSGNDILLGNAGNDTLNGGDGNDGMSGLTGNDVLNGERGFDLGFGGDGNDSLTGGNARDTLVGGDGDDSLTGGDGNDTLVGGTGNQDASSGDTFSDATATIDEAFQLNPLPTWATV